MFAKRLVTLSSLAILFVVGSGLAGLSLAQADVNPEPKPVGAARITFGLQPATKGVPDARPNFRYAVTPGGTMVDQVALRNLSTTPVKVLVYATDAINVNNGGFGLLQRGQRPRDAGAWVTVGGLAADGTVTVQPQSIEILSLSVRVPWNAQPGDHSGGVVVSVTTLSSEKKFISANVELDQRVGVRLFVRVSGQLRPSLTITNFQADYQNVLNPFGRGNTFVTYRVTNTGNVNLGGRQLLSVHGPFGPTQFSARLPDTGLLLPGAFIDEKTSVRQTWPLVYESVALTIHPLVLPGDPAAVAMYSATGNFWAVPWSLVVNLALIGVALWILGRRRWTHRAYGGGAPAPQPGSSEASVSEGAVSATATSYRTAARLGVVSSLVVVAAIAGSGPAMAAVVPYTDANATGGITLCDAQGQAETAGAIGSSLAATVVGGSAAVAPYNGNMRSAILVAYQPRQGIDPGEWSGQAMTALSRYTNPGHPMVEILPRDYTVKDFLAAYPAQWDGLVQLRIYLQVPNTPAKSDTYSATTLQVTGSTWQQVGASAGDVCGGGRSTSVVRLLGLPITAPPNRSPGSAPTAQAGATSSSRPVSSPSASAGLVPSGSSTTAGPSGSGAGGTAATAALTDASDTWDSPLVWLWPVTMLAAAGLLWRLWNRRRQGRFDGS